MLHLFQCLLVVFLGVDVPRAERLTDLRAWRNPIAQARLLEEGWCGPLAPPAHGAGPRTPKNP